MAFFSDNSNQALPSAYVDTYNTLNQLETASDFCPLCEVADTYSNGSDYQPIAKLKEAIDQAQASQMCPATFIRFVFNCYNESVKPYLLELPHWQCGRPSKVSEPEWSLINIYTHFKKHIADPWLFKQEAIRQTEAMVARTAATCLTTEGPPNPNTVRTFNELVKLRESLTSHNANRHTPMKTARLPQ